MESKQTTAVFDGKPVEIRFDNYTLFKLIKAGVSAGDLFLREGADDDKYCRAWAAVLGAEYDGDARAFVNKLGGPDVLFKLNDEVIIALERDGVIKAGGVDGGAKK